MFSSVNCCHLPYGTEREFYYSRFFLFLTSKHVSVTNTYDLEAVVLLFLYGLKRQLGKTPGKAFYYFLYF